VVGDVLAASNMPLFFRYAVMPVPPIVWFRPRAIPLHEQLARNGSDQRRARVFSRSRDSFNTDAVEPQQDDLGAFPVSHAATGGEGLSRHRALHAVA
jgi:hypothetical protein